MKLRLGHHGTVVASSPHTYQRAYRSLTFTDGAHTGRPTAMDIIGRDLHKRESRLAIKAENGTITDQRIATSRGGGDIATTVPWRPNRRFIPTTHRPR